MLVSILINNYNYGRFLTECVNSALMQTHKQIEVIVVDDGSTDDSVKIAKSFHEQITFIEQANAGQGSAYNTGFSHANGEIVIFLDSDDILLPNLVERVVETFSDPLIAKVQWRLAIIDEQGKPSGELFPETLHSGDVSPIVRKFGNYGSPPGSGNAYRRSALEGFFGLNIYDWRIGADTLPALVAPFLGNVATLASYGGFYRIHDKKESTNQFVLNNSPATPAKAVELAVHSRNAIWQELSKARYLSTGFEYEMPAQVKLRLISLRVSPLEHPIDGDSRYQCVRDGINAVIRWPGFSLKKRILYLAWIGAVALSPQHLAKRIILAGMRRKKG